MTNLLSIPPVGISTSTDSNSKFAIVAAIIIMVVTDDMSRDYHALICIVNESAFTHSDFES